MLRGSVRGQLGGGGGTPTRSFSALAICLRKQPSSPISGSQTEANCNFYGNISRAACEADLALPVCSSLFAPLKPIQSLRDHRPWLTSEDTGSKATLKVRDADLSCTSAVTSRRSLGFADSRNLCILLPTAVGATDVFIRHPTPHVAPRDDRPQWLINYEAKRPRWLMEMLAEAFGV